MPTSHNYESLRNTENTIQILAPVGLTELANTVVTEALNRFQLDKKVRIRVKPVASLDSGDTFAFYRPSKDNLHINVPLNKLRGYLYQRSLVNLPIISESLGSRLEEIDDTTLTAVRKNKSSVDKALRQPEKKPEWIVDYDQEQYEANRLFEIVQQAIDVYLYFLEDSLTLSGKELSPEQLATLVSFVKYVETELFSVKESDIENVLHEGHRLPHAYSLFMAFGRENPRTIEASRQFVDTIIDSVVHEKIHQLFAHKRNPALLEEVDDLLEKVTVPSFFSGQKDEDKINKYFEHLDRQGKVAQEVESFLEGNKTLEDIFPVMLSCNQETTQLAIPSDLPKRIQRGLAFRSYLIGVEETMLALVSAKEQNGHYLSLLCPYFTEFNCIIPNLETVQELERIVERNGTDYESMVRDVLNTIYTFRAFQQNMKRMK